MKDPPKETMLLLGNPRLLDEELLSWLLEGRNT